MKFTESYARNTASLGKAVAVPPRCAARARRGHRARRSGTSGPWSATGRTGRASAFPATAAFAVGSELARPRRRVRGATREGPPAPICCRLHGSSRSADYPRHRAHEEEAGLLGEPHRRGAVGTTTQHQEVASTIGDRALQRGKKLRASSAKPLFPFLDENTVSSTSARASASVAVRSDPHAGESVCARHRFNATTARSTSSCR